MHTTNILDKQLTRLDEEIRRLKLEYDAYFDGQAAEAPYRREDDVNAMIRTLRDAPGMTFSQGFRYNALVARLNGLKEVWQQTLAEMAEHDHHDHPTGQLPQTPSGPVIHTDPIRNFTALTVYCQDPKAEPEKVRLLYESFLSAKRCCGESVDAYPFDRFAQMLVAQARQIKETYRSPWIAFTVEVHEGRVRFKGKASEEDH